MSAPRVPFAHTVARDLTLEDCTATLRRACFGHLSFLRGEHVDVLPARFAFLDNWAYFRGNEALGDTIMHNRWMVLSVTEHRDAEHFASVILRGECYTTDDTGSISGDKAALEGISALRDRLEIGQVEQRTAQPLRVFRIHADEIRGGITMVPCPVGHRPYDSRERKHLRVANELEPGVAADGTTNKG